MTAAKADANPLRERIAKVHYDRVRDRVRSDLGRRIMPPWDDVLPEHRENQLADADAILASLASEPVAGTVREADIVTGAMAIARSRGHDPEDPAPLTEMCTEDNAPVPEWMVFVEEAEACLKAVSSPPAPAGREIKFGYTNYRRENSYRRAQPISIRYGSSEYHKTDQWLMLAFDIEKNEQREFAMRDMLLVEGAQDALALSPQGGGAGDDGAEFWCRLMGEAIDALDDLSADYDNFTDAESRQDFASRRADEIRAKYKDRKITPTPPLPGAADRAAVIEECAKVCNRWIASKNLHEHLAATDMAAAIRALAPKGAA